RAARSVLDGGEHGATLRTGRAARQGPIMRDTTLLQQALGLTAPWTVSGSDFDAQAHRLDIQIDFAPGSRFACPACGAAGCPAYDTERKTWRHLGGGLIVEFLECEADPVGTPGLEMARRQSVERGALRLRQIGRVAQPDVAGPAQQALPLLFGTAHLVDRVVDDLDGMELIESDFCLGQAFAHAFDEGRAHVDADFADRF